MPIMRCFLILFLSFCGMRAYSQEDIQVGDSEDTTLQNLWVDSLHHLNVHINNKTQTISFSVLKNRKSATIGKFQLVTLSDVCLIRLEDLNGDGTNEVIAATCHNMNGNQWFDVFMFVPEKQTMVYSGSFNTDYELDSANKTINVTYTGSWYMDRFRTQYIWVGNKLLPEKMMLISLKRADMQCDSEYVSLYKSIPARTGHLKRIQKKLRGGSDKRTEYIWEHFFDKKAP